MQLKNSEYQTLSDLFFAISENPLHRKMALQGYKSFDELYQRAGEVLDAVRRRHLEQNKKTACYIANKRKANKNYAR